VRLLSGVVATGGCLLVAVPAYAEPVPRCRGRPADRRGLRRIPQGLLRRRCGGPAREAQGRPGAGPAFRSRARPGHRQRLAGDHRAWQGHVRPQRIRPRCPVAQGAGAPGRSIPGIPQPALGVDQRPVRGGVQRVVPAVPAHRRTGAGSLRGPRLDHRSGPARALRIPPARGRREGHTGSHDRRGRHDLEHDLPAR
jgi:hypothetical protein